MQLYFVYYFHKFISADIWSGFEICEETTCFHWGADAPEYLAANNEIGGTLQIVFKELESVKANTATFVQEIDQKPKPTNSFVQKPKPPLENQQPRRKHSSAVLGSNVAAYSTCLFLLPQVKKRGMKVSPS